MTANELTASIVELLEHVPHSRVTRSGNDVHLRFSLHDVFDRYDHTTFSVTLPHVSHWSGEVVPGRVAQSGNNLPTGSAEGMRSVGDLLHALADVKDYMASEAVLAPLRAEADKAEEQRRAEREERLERERQEMERRRAAAAERAKLVAEREEQLLTEFLGEKVRIRLQGMKRWRPCTVDSEVSHRDEDGEPDEWRPVLLYVFEKHGWRETNLSQVQALEVKVGSRYRNVWDDGLEDLRPWDREKIKVSAPYDGMPQ